MDFQQPKKKNNSFKLITSLSLLPFIFFVNNVLGLIIKNLIGFSDELNLFAIVSFTQGLLLISFTLYLAIVRWQMTFKDLGLEVKGWSKAFWQGLRSGPLVFLLVMVGGNFVEYFRPMAGDTQPFTQMVLKAGTGSEMVILFLLGVVIAPVAEEIYFRGFLFPMLKKRLGLTGGIVISGVFFGLLHFDILRFLPLALGGMALAWVYHKTDSLYAPITAHGVWNALMLAILFFSQKL